MVMVSFQAFARPPLEPEPGPADPPPFNMKLFKGKDSFRLPRRFVQVAEYQSILSDNDVSLLCAVPAAPPRSHDLPELDAVHSDPGRARVAQPGHRVQPGQGRGGLEGGAALPAPPSH